MKDTENTETPFSVKPVCVVRGSQPLLAERLAERISKHFLGDPPDGESAVFYADETPAPEVLASVSNLSMFSAKKVAVLKRSESLDSRSLELIAQYSQSPPPHALLILISADPLKPALKPSGNISVKTVEWDARKIHEKVIEEADAMGIVMGSAAALYLCSLVGDDLGIINCELAKLAEAYGHGARIEKQQIDSMLKKRKLRDVFEFTNAVADGQKSEALAVLAEIAAQNQIEPLVIVSAVSSRIRNILKASAVRAGCEGASPEEQKKQIAKELKIKSGAAHFIWKQSHKFSLSQAGRIIAALAAADGSLKRQGHKGYETVARMTVSLLSGR